MNMHYVSTNSVRLRILSWTIFVKNRFRKLSATNSVQDNFRNENCPKIKICKKYCFASWWLPSGWKMICNPLYALCDTECFLQALVQFTYSLLFFLNLPFIFKLNSKQFGVCHLKHTTTVGVDRARGA